MITIVQSKTGKTITIPLSGYLANELMQYRAGNTCDRLFEDREITQAVVIRRSEHFGTLFRELGILDFTFHNMRHTFSSLLQSELGVGAVVVQGMTGHSSLGMLQRYSHTGLNNKKTAIYALTNHVLNTSKEKLIRLESKTGTA